MLSMRIWPKAPRACLLARISCSETILVERSVKFFCAVSITASRSFSLAIDSCVLREVSLRSVPTRCVMRSSRSLTARAMSPWRATLISAKLCKRPLSSASSIACDSVSRRRRLICTIKAMARVSSANTASPASASTTRTGSTVTLPTCRGSMSMVRTYSPIRSFRPKQEHIDRRPPQPYLSPSNDHPAHPHPPRSTIAQAGQARRARRRRAAPADRRHVRDHVRRAGHRPCRAANRHFPPAHRYGPGQGGGAQDAPRHGQSQDLGALGGDAGARGGLPLDPRLYRRGRAPGQDPRRLYRPGRRAAGGRAGRHLVDPGAARDRPSERCAVHRLSVAVEARHGAEKVQEAEARRSALGDIACPESDICDIS